MAILWVNPHVRRVCGKHGDLPSVSSRSLAVHLQFNMPVRPDLLQLRWDGFEPQHAGPFILSGWFWLSLPACGDLVPDQKSDPALCVGSAEFLPLDCQGSPYLGSTFH